LHLTNVQNVAKRNRLATCYSDVDKDQWSRGVIRKREREGERKWGGNAGDTNKEVVKQSNAPWKKGRERRENKAITTTTTELKLNFN